MINQKQTFKKVDIRFGSNEINLLRNILKAKRLDPTTATKEEFVYEATKAEILERIEDAYSKGCCYT